MGVSRLIIWISRAHRGNSFRQTGERRHCSVLDEVAFAVRGGVVTARRAESRALASLPRVVRAATAPSEAWTSVVPIETGPEAVDARLRALAEDLGVRLVRAERHALARASVGPDACEPSDAAHLTVVFDQAVIRIAEQGIARLAVNRTNLHIYASLISDDGARILASASTIEPEVRKQLGGSGKGGNVAAAEIVGKRIAERAKAVGVEKVAFDRSGFSYHGRVKALADAAREAGL